MSLNEEKSAEIPKTLSSKHIVSQVFDYSSNKPYVRSVNSSKASISALPKLPGSCASQASLSASSSFDNEQVSSHQNRQNYVEFNFRNLDNASKDEFIIEKEIASNYSPNLMTEASPNNDSKTKSSFYELEEEKNDDQANADGDDDDDDFFNSDPFSWKDMKTVTEIDYYNEKGEIEFAKSQYQDPSNDKTGINGYTKIETEEQVSKYADLDRHTDFLFQRPDNIDFDDIESDSAGDDSDTESYLEDENITSEDKLGSLKDMLSDVEKFAYVGVTKVICHDMATELARTKFTRSISLSRILSLGQKNFANWTSYIMNKLFDHMGFDEDEKRMINDLPLHGIEVEDLTGSLKAQYTLANPFNHSKSDLASKNTIMVDLRWVLVCNLLLLLLSDGYYDSRSRTLLVRFSKALEISNLELLQFERRLILNLELESKGKSIESNDEHINDRKFIERQIKKNRNKRYAYIGLATLGGSLAIGLSAGLLAPLIGAGIAAGLTTVGITGTSGFLAGVGGSAIITTGGVLTGARVGSKAGAKRSGDVHTFEFKPLYNIKRTNLIVTVSGWMNGKADDVRLPFSTVDPVMGDMFSLYWEPEMLQSMGQTINILASEALTSSIQQILGATILTTLMSAIQLPMALSKLSYLLDNPWNVSLDRAWKAGRILAETIIEGNLGVRPITLVGFSLGARLIYSCLITLAKRGAYGLVENVILLGSPIAVKSDQITMARTVVSGRFINGYSKKDWVLGYLFRATSGGISTVAGLSAIEKIEGIENLDLTDLVLGHMSYRKFIPKILKRLDWEVLGDEFAEIEEPDAAEMERQRKLVDEFDEAHTKMMDDIKSGKKSSKNGWKSIFKPKQKDWWQLYYGTTKPAVSSDSNMSIGQENSEKNIDKLEEGTNPLFDLSALNDEIQQLSMLSQNREPVLKEIRERKMSIKDTNKPINEDEEL